MLTVIQYHTMDSLRTRPYDKQRQASGSGQAWDFTFFIFLLVTILVHQLILFPFLSYRTDAIWGMVVQLFGGFLIFKSILLHIWSRSHLQHYYAERVEIQPGHQVHPG